MTRIITVPALKSTLGFIALDLVGVGIVGDAVAKWCGFDSSLLMPVSALICIAAGLDRSTSLRPCAQFLGCSSPSHD